MSAIEPMATPPAPRRRQAQRTEMSDRLMSSAAVQLLVSDGVRGTTLARLGQRAGYSRGLATHRFGSKAGLLRHVLQQASQRWLQLLQSEVGGQVGADALCAAVDAHLHFLREAPDDVRAMYLLWFTSIDPASEYRANVARVHEAQRADISRWVRLGQAAGCVPASVDAERVAEQFCASMAGMVFQWLVNDRVPLEAMHAQLKSDVRQRLGAPAPAPRSVRIKSKGNHHDRRPHL
jgi:AcrR family transcriptional regulator